MAALTDGRQAFVMVGPKRSAGMKASEKIYQGAIVMLDSSGRALAGATATGAVGAGIARPNQGLNVWHNTGADNALTVEYDEGIFGFVNGGGGDAFAAGDEGRPAYIADDQTVHKTDGSGTKSPAGRFIRLDGGLAYVAMSAEIARQIAEEQIISTGQTYTQTYSTANRTVANPTAVDLTDNTGGAAGTTLAAGVGSYVLSFPINLPDVTTAADFVTDMLIGHKFKILGIAFNVTTIPVTTAGKGFTVNIEIGTVDVTGGVLTLTSANCTPRGAKVAGTAITAANTGTSSDFISIEITSVTSFIEGAGVLEIRIQNMDTADAAASLAAQTDALVVDDLDNRQTVTALIDDLQTADIVD